MLKVQVKMPSKWTLLNILARSTITYRNFENKLGTNWTLLRKQWAVYWPKLMNFHQPSIRLRSTVTHIMWSWLVFPSTKQCESAYETSQLCLKNFIAIGVDIKINDIDIAHRVTLGYAAVTEGQPKLILCKFTRRLARDQVMALRREVTKIIPSSIGLREQDSMESVGIFYHLSPQLQYFMSDARKFKERFGYTYCLAEEKQNSGPTAI